jgi:hypothetical protein
MQLQIHVSSITFVGPVPRRTSGRAPKRARLNTAADAAATAFQGKGLTQIIARPGGTPKLAGVAAQATDANGSAGT